MNTGRTKLRLKVDCANHSAKGCISDDIALSARPNVFPDSQQISFSSLNTVATALRVNGRHETSDDFFNKCL